MLVQLLFLASGPGARFIGRGRIQGKPGNIEKRESLGDPELSHTAPLASAVQAEVLAGSTSCLNSANVPSL